MLTALIAGFRGGLLATAISALAAYHFLFIPEGFVFKGFVNTFSMVVFTCMGVFMSAVAERFRRTRDRSEELAFVRTTALSLINEHLTQEVSERKKAEEKLRARAELLNLAHDAILVRDIGDKITL